MDEFIDILDSEGKHTGKVALKSEAHKHGWPHHTVHVWFYTRNFEVLLQQRGATKATHPLLWDVSVAGHVAAGESIISAAIREVQEELGLQIVEGDLRKLGVFKALHEHSKDLVDYEFHHTFLAELKVPVEKLRKQEAEVNDLKLLPLKFFTDETGAAETRKNYVPDQDRYYLKVAAAIRNILQGI